ncbi:MAG: glucose-6-phosphate isomerase [Candidatus Dadabacteria bacterium]|nr:MAG: glucose-6-phosphate isomerase [Candidatus Dadabacteria bacterium]
MSWQKYKSYLYYNRSLGLALDISKVSFDDDAPVKLEPALQSAYDEMEKLENGALANIDENRMVGHYWLRDSSRAPDTQIKAEIEANIHAIKSFAESILSGNLKSIRNETFKDLLVIGIGGSALGPQLLYDALGSNRNGLRLHFFDNTDPDGYQRVLNHIPEPGDTLCLVVSKSGGTKETRNGMLVMKKLLNDSYGQFAGNFVAITSPGSALERMAQTEGWLATFPVWEWVGGRTSVFSSVGLLPAALHAVDIDSLLKGARLMDEETRLRDTFKNPAAMLAQVWYLAGEGRGAKDMVVLPYSDRLLLFSRYLQQLIMESLGKRYDRQGREVFQGIAVYGNKGSTDQHAYVQQLRDGLNNFFVTFIEVLNPFSQSGIEYCDAVQMEVEQQVDCSDYLTGFYLGTREALFQAGRDSISITIDSLDAEKLGMLIALFERAVGLYASLIDINAYHQPGVEAGKKAAARVLEIQRSIITALSSSDKALSVEEVAECAGCRKELETVFKVLRHLVATGRVSLKVTGNIFDDRYFLAKE